MVVGEGVCGKEGKGSAEGGLRADCLFFCPRGVRPPTPFCLKLGAPPHLMWEAATQGQRVPGHQPHDPDPLQAADPVATPPPPPKSAKKSQQIGEQIGGPIFRQNRLPVPWISVPDP